MILVGENLFWPPSIWRQRKRAKNIIARLKKISWRILAATAETTLGGILELARRKRSWFYLFFDGYDHEEILMSG